MPFRFKTGARVGVFIITSDERHGRYTQVKCPMCKNKVWRHQSNLRRVSSCGCAWSLHVTQTTRLNRHKDTVRQAIEAFRSDYRYAEQMAEVPNRLRERRSQE